MRRYRVLAHTADTGIIAAGSSLAEVFENAAYGMFDLTFDLSRVPARESRQVIGAGDSREELLVGWLSALLAESEIEGLVFSSFAVGSLGEGRVEGSASGAPAAGRVLRGPPVKAVTYHDLAVEDVPEGFRVRVIFDV